MTVRTSKRVLKVTELADVLEALVIIYGETSDVHIATPRVNWAHGELHKYLLAHDLVDAVDSEDDLPF